jgi:hypothetical protein
MTAPALFLSGTDFSLMEGYATYPSLQRMVQLSRVDGKGAFGLDVKNETAHFGIKVVAYHCPVLECLESPSCDQPFPK